MEGLSNTKRRLYLVGLVLAFLLVSPLLGLYASGYRLSDDFQLIKTGGIHVDVPVSGASFFLDDEYQGQGSLFQKSFFVQNLLPGTYMVRIERDGFHGWRKEVAVYPTLITSGRAFLTPKELVTTLIPPYLSVDGTATSTATTKGKPLPNLDYTDVMKLFSDGGEESVATTTIQYRGATTTVIANGNIGLWKDSRGLHAWWLGSEDRFPYFFCEQEVCKRELLVASDGSKIGHVDFSPEGNQFVLIEWPDGVFMTELDLRSPQNIHPIYPVAGASFRVRGGTLYILDGDKLLEAGQ